MRKAIQASIEQSRSHEAHWRQRREAPIEPDALHYLALGDSAGVGVGVEDPDAGYVGLLAARLAQSTGRRVHVTNLSVSGARASDVVARQLPQLAELPAPDAVTCVIGGNDVAWARRFKPADFAHSLTVIAAALPTGSVLGTLPRFGHWPYQGRALRANAAIARVAAEHGHRLADIDASTRTLSLRRYYASTFAADRFHPNELGHELWADALWPQLDPAVVPS